MDFLNNKFFEFHDKSSSGADNFSFYAVFIFSATMNKVLLTIAVLYLASCSLAASEDNMIDNQDNSTSVTTESLMKGPAQDMIASIYRRAVAKALHDKVTELQTKLLKGDNAIPVAMDILKYALFSNQAKDTIRKVTEHVLGIMSPEVKKQAVDEGIWDEPTTPMPKVEPKVTKNEEKS